MQPHFAEKQFLVCVRRCLCIYFEAVPSFFDLLRSYVPFEHENDTIDGHACPKLSLHSLRHGSDPKYHKDNGLPSQTEGKPIS